MSPPRAFTYGVAKPEDVSSMTGREMLQAMIEGRVPAPPIAQTLGFWLVEIGDGQCAFEGEAQPGKNALKPGIARVPAFRGSGNEALGNRMDDGQRRSKFHRKDKTRRACTDYRVEPSIRICSGNSFPSEQTFHPLGC